jgi:hypothetical protein
MFLRSSVRRFQEKYRSSEIQPDGPRSEVLAGRSLLLPLYFYLGLLERLFFYLKSENSFTFLYRVGIIFFKKKIRPTCRLASVPNSTTYRIYFLAQNIFYEIK